MNADICLHIMFGQDNLVVPQSSIEVSLLSVWNTCRLPGVARLKGQELNCRTLNLFRINAQDGRSVRV